MNTPISRVLNDAVASINQQIQLAIDRQTTIRDKINGAAESLTTATANAAELKSELDTLITQATSSVTEVKTTYENNVKGNLDSLSANLEFHNRFHFFHAWSLERALRILLMLQVLLPSGLTGLQTDSYEFRCSVKRIFGKVNFSCSYNNFHRGFEGMSAVTNLLSEDSEDDFIFPLLSGQTG